MCESVCFLFLCPASTSLCSPHVCFLPLGALLRFPDMFDERGVLSWYERSYRFHTKFAHQNLKQNLDLQFESVLLFVAPEYERIDDSGEIGREGWCSE